MAGAAAPESALCLPTCCPVGGSAAPLGLSAAAQDALQVLEAGGRSIDATLPALDVGAAPGGWTEALLGYGCARVTAVDPAAMSAALMGSEMGARIEHIDRPAQEAAAQ
eukprot:COSAG01_NODE_1613_length_9731_cov_11.760590_10_plen_109_part_00